jgi:hypothetical protein
MIADVSETLIGKKKSTLAFSALDPELNEFDPQD